MSAASPTSTDAIRAFLRDAGRQAEVLDEYTSRVPSTTPVKDLQVVHRIDAAVVAELAAGVGLGVDTEELSYIRDELLNHDTNLRVKGLPLSHFLKPAAGDFRAVAAGVEEPGALPWSFRHTATLYGMLFAVGATDHGKAWVHPPASSPPGSGPDIQTSPHLADFRAGTQEFLTGLVGRFQLATKEERVAVPGSQDFKVGPAEAAACVRAVENHIRFLAWE